MASPIRRRRFKIVIRIVAGEKRGHVTRRACPMSTTRVRPTGDLAVDRTKIGRMEAKSGMPHGR